MSDSSPGSRSWDYIKPRVGNLEQVVSVTHSIDDDGASRGSRRIRLINGGGLDLELHPDRALDIGRFIVDGVNIGWISPVGASSPFLVENKEREWLRTFSGGFLTTCGLDTFGGQSDHGGQHFPLHGRLGSNPARILQTLSSPERVGVISETKQVTTFGENLRLKREISSLTFSRSIRMRDEVTNLGFEEIGHMILYHFNIGWPMIGPAAELLIDAKSRKSLRSEVPAGDFAKLTPPTVGEQETVFLHELQSNATPSARLRNPDLGLELSLRVVSGNLPYLFQWKMLDQGYYVVGLEPANGHVLSGRHDAESEGAVVKIPAGHSVSYEIEIQIDRF